MTKGARRLAKRKRVSAEGTVGGAAQSKRMAATVVGNPDRRLAADSRPVRDQADVPAPDSPPVATDVDLNAVVRAVTGALVLPGRGRTSLTCEVAPVPLPVCLDFTGVAEALTTLVLTVRESIQHGRLDIVVRAEPTTAWGRSGNVRILVATAGTGRRSNGWRDDSDRAPLDLSRPFAIIRLNGGALSVDRRGDDLELRVSFPSRDRSPWAAAARPL